MNESSEGAIFAPIPDYYDTMYLDGYTPEQIYIAKRNEMKENINERRTWDLLLLEVKNLKIK